MSGRQLSQAQPYWNNSLAIRQEIQRFESVHPSIYAIYDLIESIPDPLLGQQIRDHVVCIEDSFVNSQEWTLSRSVPDLRLGIVGSLSSGKSALVHRYLTGTYMQEESPEGGRFKKEISIDGQSYLLLIRDEGGSPELQFTAWVDAVIFVFSLENESSFNAVYNYYSKMAQFRNAAEVPIILVGTQDAINENSPRLIEESRARKLAAELRRCPYYETCATYGINVDRVFQDACQRIIQQRLTTNPNAPRPTTPNHHTVSRHYSTSVTPVGSSHYPGHAFSSSSLSAVVAGSTVGPVVGIIGTGHSGITGFNGGLGGSAHNLHVASNGPNARGAMPPPTHTPYSSQYQGKPSGGGSSRRVNPPVPPQSAPASVNVDRNSLSSQNTQSSNMLGSVESLSMRSTPPAGVTDTLTVPANKEGKDLPTPTSTPTTSRKSRRRSNLFTPSSKKEEKDKDKEKDKNKSAGELGSGRAIPIKQGYLYKRSHKALNKDWKKKYVTLCDDGKLTYHSSLHDYMDDSHGKEISLQYVTVKVPGQKPRGSRTTQLPQPIPGVATTGQTLPPANGLNDAVTAMSISGYGANKDTKRNDNVLLTAYEVLKEPVGRFLGSEDPNVNGDKNETPNVKKRHRRMKSSGNKANDLEDAEGYEFQIVSLDNKVWHFEATSLEEREEWVSAIELQILNTLQGNESSKSKSRMNSLVDAASIQSLRSNVAGNNRCADCDSPNPDWASLNLGILVCIECSGIHRNLGSHISRVRSLDLDEWPPGHIAVMLGLGNSISNSIWEARVKGSKPNPQSSREEKERWIRAKYEHKEFIQYPSNSVPLAQQLVDAVCSSDLKTVTLLLAHANAEDVNCSVGGRDLRTPLHLASALGNLALVQLLIWHNANVKALDHEGRTCLTFARASNVPEVIELLIANGCPEGPASLPANSTLNRRKTVTVTGPVL